MGVNTVKLPGEEALYIKIHLQSHLIQPQVHWYHRRLETIQQRPLFCEFLSPQDFSVTSSVGSDRVSRKDIAAFFTGRKRVCV